ncbi:MAG: hypothetical protein QOE45_312 [Frankiaceae bacterium]|jgi:hypothetical protein|nr:hypothetical protein [Frankiaceae bacterium]
MRRLLVALVAVAAVAPATTATATASPPNPDGTVVRAWNDLAFATVRDTKGGDATAARLYAMVDVAVFDAVNGLAADPREPALVPGSGQGDPTAAAATAAHDVLTGLYPSRAATYDARLAQDLASVDSPSRRNDGRAWGAHVAAAVLAARADDGSAPNDTLPAGTGPGRYRAAWSGAQFRNLRPFAIDDPERYAGSGPPALASKEYARAFEDVRTVGNAATADPAASATFKYWSLGGGTDQPPGAWLQVGGAVSAARSLSLAETARLFALESMALADTVAPTYATKYRFAAWRPDTAIHEADTDGNDATAPDATWTARGGSASSPEHWSGHSSFSAAGAAVLAGFFCTDRVRFTLATDSGAGEARTYPSFSAAALEAGRSRVLGGLHFEFSNRAGLVSGVRVAYEVLTTALRPTGQRRSDDC